MEYTIGQLSRLLGISIEGIRKYERSGLISSTRGEESNYRKYKYLDVTSLIRTKIYRSLGYSVNSTVELTNTCSAQDIHRSLIARRSEMDTEIQLLKKKQLLIDELEHELEVAETMLNGIHIEQRPGFYRFEFAKNGEIYDDKAMEKLFRLWIEQVPFVTISTRYAKDGNVYGGLALNERYADGCCMDMSILSTSLTEYLPPARCLSVIHRESRSSHADPACLDALLSHARDNSFTLADDIYSRNVVSIHKSGDYTRYRRVYAEIIE